MLAEDHNSSLIAESNLWKTRSQMEEEIIDNRGRNSGNAALGIKGCGFPDCSFPSPHRKKTPFPQRGEI